MDESQAQIEDHISATRQELGHNLQELEHRVKEAADWHVQYRRHPLGFLGAAFVVGFLIAKIL